MKTYAVFEDIEREIVQRLSMAKESLKICVAWINGQIYGPVIGRLLPNVRVEIICDANNSNRLTVSHWPAAVTVTPVLPRWQQAFMHDKFCIIDDETLITGSYNWSRKAPLSFENIVVIEHDYPLVKQFLHEFRDLQCFSQQAERDLSRCPLCRKATFNLVVLGRERGLYNESRADIWTVCVGARHVVSRVAALYEQYLNARLGLEDIDADLDEAAPKERMKELFERERASMDAVQQRFQRVGFLPIHAVGVVEMRNQPEHYKHGAPPDYFVRLSWRDMRYRKIIPAWLDHHEGDIEQIIESQLSEGAI